MDDWMTLAFNQLCMILQDKIIVWNIYLYLEKNIEN